MFFCCPVMPQAPASSAPTVLPEHVQPVDLAHAYRLINHGPTVLVSTAHQGQRNVMAAAWNMPLDFNPPKVAVVIDKATATRPLLEASGWLALNVPCMAQADAAFTVGTVSALERTPSTTPDKLTALGLATWSPPDADTPPLLQGCVAWLLCKLLPAPELAQAHDLFLAEVTAAWADERAFSNGKYRPLTQWPTPLRTLHHLGAGHFLVPGDAVQGQPLHPVSVQNF
jgi:flavin reductase (DIM6/NTAB) family NADH-FMN oxidoreductase RutF